MILKYLLPIFIILCLAFFTVLLKKWKQIKDILRFRNNLKPGEYCHFKLGNKKVLGYVLSVWKKENVVRVRHLGFNHKIKFYEVYP